MLSWMRWLTGWFWDIVNSGETGGGSLLRWFADNWLNLAVFLIVVGFIVDWLIWMIRWRPHWLWLRKRQIIYEEVPVRKKPVKKEKKTARPVREEAEDFDDPFAAPGEDPYKPAAPADDLAEWDSTEDPYAHPAANHTGKKVSKFGRQNPF